MQSKSSKFTHCKICGKKLTFLTTSWNKEICGTCYSPDGNHRKKPDSWIRNRNIIITVIAVALLLFNLYTFSTKGYIRPVSTLVSIMALGFLAWIMVQEKMSSTKN